jgi:hypothetical protein
MDYALERVLPRDPPGGVSARVDGEAIAAWLQVGSPSRRATPISVGMAGHFGAGVEGSSTGLLGADKTDIREGPLRGGR